MKEQLINHLRERHPEFDKYNDEGYYFTSYEENINEDALSNKWLENGTSYIYKVGVFTAIDSNKCDYLHIVIGTQRYESSEPEVKGYLYFCEGENDDIAKVLTRAIRCLGKIHPVFLENEW